MKKKKTKVREEVIRRGEKVLKSDMFRRIMGQRHHNVTVGVHSIGVAEDAVRIADALEKIGIHADRDALVRASLCHDLGMLDRDTRYRSDVESWVKHPGSSLENAGKVCPDLTDKEKDSILHHMWPMLPIPPRSLEGFIICFADKKSSFRELLRRPGKRIDEAYKKLSDS